MLIHMKKNSTKNAETCSHGNVEHKLTFKNVL